MIETSFAAMGTTVTLLTASGEQAERCRQLFAAMEHRLSRFLAHSELTELNDDPSPSIEVSAPLAAVLGVAQDLRDRTNGLVDPAVGAAVAEWGYDRTFDQVIGGGPAPMPPPPGAWGVVDRTVHRTPGVRFDLGGIAKGWTADLAVEDGCALLVSVGGDIASNLPDAVVEILDGDGAVAAKVKLGVGGLATSSVSKRRWATADGEANHIIDPRTMTPTRSPVITASAACATAAESEAAAKAILILGSDGLRWAEGCAWVDTAMVGWHDRSVFATKGWEMVA
jgi:FAD:protein FMN transferase